MAFIQRRRNKEDGRTTDRSRLIRAIEAELREAKHPFLSTYRVGEDAEYFAVEIRRFFRREGIKDISISVKGDSFIAGTKQARKMSTLKNMIRRLARETDNESLYEEAMELVKTI